MIASLYQSESDIVWDFRRDVVSDAMGSCTCHLAHPGDAPRIFHSSDGELCRIMEVLIAVSFCQATLPVAKLGGQRLICARFMTSCERIDRKSTRLNSSH